MQQSQVQQYVKPPLEHLLNVFDFESIAQKVRDGLLSHLTLAKVMKKEAWDYYSAGADDEVTLRENHLAFQRVWLRPRVLVDVTKVDTGCKILGCDSSFPLYISYVCNTTKKC